MEDFLMPLCLISRLHSFYANKSHILDVVNSNKPGLFEIYKQIKTQFLVLLESAGIFSQATPTISKFGNMVCTLNLVHFYYSPSKITVPDRLKRTISEKCGQNCSDAESSLFFGFTGRFVDADNTDLKFIGKATHLADRNDIGFDYTTSIVLGEKQLAIDLAHELLHDAGYDELHVLEKCDVVYEAAQAEIDLFAHKVFTELGISFLRFLSSLKELTSANTFLCQRLRAIASEIYFEGYPYLPDEQIVFHINHPLTGDKRSLFLY